MRPLPSWSLSEPFCSTSWPMAIYLSSSSCHLAACRLAAVNYLFSFWLVSHISLLLSSLKSPTQGSSSKSRRTGLWRLVVFADVLVCEGNTLLWRSIFYIDKFKSCMLWWHLWFRTLNVLFSCLCLSLVLSINSPNATSLHSRCIWEGVLRV